MDVVSHPMPLITQHMFGLPAWLAAELGGERGGLKLATATAWPGHQTLRLRAVARPNDAPRRKW
eukprot:14222041-Alexandrium_andersonii.AAC.1